MILLFMAFMAIVFGTIQLLFGDSYGYSHQEIA